MSTYNGWTNYETWNIPLWFDNEYDLYITKRNVLQRMINSAMNMVTDECGIEQALEQVTEKFSAWYIKTAKSLVYADNGLFDIASGDLGLVNWDEIIEGELEELTLESLMEDFDIEPTPVITGIEYSLKQSLLGDTISNGMIEGEIATDSNRYDLASRVRGGIFINYGGTYNIPTIEHFKYAIDEGLGLKLITKNKSNPTLFVQMWIHTGE